ncbi:MAG: hypothetical protein JWM87_2183 [Candidatus Eremiobacteraeota bacterium]|nr:hypothetical protein [Candidatus Eremiobacteraeota bacterium]
MADNFERRAGATREALSDLVCPPMSEIFGPGFARAASRRSGRSWPLAAPVLAAVFVAALGLSAIAAVSDGNPRQLVRALSASLSEAMGRRVDFGNLRAVASPSTDTRTRALWTSVNALQHAQRAWAVGTSDAVVLRGSAKTGPFYITAVPRAAPAGGPAILIPDDPAPAHPRTKLFTTRATQLMLLYPAEMSVSERDALIERIRLSMP